MIPYKHEPFTDFTIEENQKAYQEGIKTSRRIFRRRLSVNYWWRTYYDRREN